MATSSSRSNSNSAAKIVGPKAAKMGGGNINPRGEVGRPGDPGGHMWPKAAAKPNESKSTQLKPSRPYSAQDRVESKSIQARPNGSWPTEIKKVNSNPVPNRTSPSLSQPGRLGGAHAGGQGISEEEMFAGKGPSKLGGLGALGARIARATEGEVPLP